MTNPFHFFLTILLKNHGKKSKLVSKNTISQQPRSTTITAYSAKRATVSTRPRFLTNFLKIRSMVVQERRGNLKSRSRVNFKLSEKPRPSIKKCQKSVKNLSLVETVARFAL